MVKYLWQFLLCVTLSLPVCASDTLSATMKQLEEVEVSASAITKESFLSDAPISANSFSLSELENTFSLSTKDLASMVPNFHLPDYGSQMTSSIYVRGLGSRIDQPVVGLLVDNVPILNKNNFDLDLFDLAHVTFLRGPQGTLFGRNTQCGLISLQTISPFDYQGTRASLSYGTANTIHAKLSTYKKVSDVFAFSLAGNYNHTSGLFTNSYYDEPCDPSNSGNLRSRQIWRLKNKVLIDNSVSLSLLKQGGYAYALIDSLNRHHSVEYNDVCQYKRFSVLDGLSVNFHGDKVDLSSVTSYQFLDDDMNMDQDFQPESIFTLEQTQRENAVSQEIFFASPKSNEKRLWSHKSGAWGFYKKNRLSAPVTFKRDGIEQLILSNANRGIQSVFPSDYLDIREDQFVISSDFVLPTGGVALYHQSDFRVKNWRFALGLRLDYEKSSMVYDNHASMHYLFSLLMKEYKELNSVMNGKETKEYLELLPKVSVTYHLPNECNLYAYAAKGYKAGGFNTQIFSDILQNKLMGDMMENMGMVMDGLVNSSYDVRKATSYDPEYSWTYEMGGHFNWLNHRLSCDADIFLIRCKNQQLTVFPSGKSTGRMMTNAGRSKSIGGEISSSYRVKYWTFNASYGYTNATFVEYDDGNHSYAGNRLPFAPVNTVSAAAQYVFYLHRRLVDEISVEMDWKGIGEIYWDEANSVEQPFYSLVGASISLRKERFTLSGKATNLLDENYDTFYFVSVGNRFCQSGKPRELTIVMKYEF